MLSYKFSDKCSFRFGFTVDGAPIVNIEFGVVYVPEKLPYTFYREVRTCFHDIANSIKMQEFKKLFDIQEDTPIHFDARGPLYTFSNELYTGEEVAYYGIKNFVPVTIEQVAMVPHLFFKFVPVEYYYEVIRPAGEFAFQCGIFCTI